MRRLVVFEFRMLGDAVMSIPFVRSAKEQREVFVCCTAASVPVFEAVVSRDHILEWTPPWTAAAGKYDWRRWRGCGIKSWIKRVRDLNADEAVCVWSDPRVHGLMLAARIPERIGFPLSVRNYLGSHDPRRRKRLRLGVWAVKVIELFGSLKLLSVSLTRSAYWQHHLEDWRQCASCLNLPWRAEPPWIDVDPPVEQDFDRKIWGIYEQARARDVGLWVVHPGARMPSKRWEREKFQACLESFFAEHKIPVLIIDPPEGGGLKPVGPLQVLVQTPEFADLLKIFSLSDGVLCNDSLASHLGAALGKSVVAIFGSGDPRWFAPSGKKHVVLSDPDCEYHPCLDACRLDTCRCISNVTIESVMNGLKRLRVPGSIPSESQ